MQITLNGEKKEFPEALTVLGLLQLLSIQHQRVAVELNESIVKKDRYAETAVKEGDCLEVVSFMGGGEERGFSSGKKLTAWSSCFQVRLRGAVKMAEKGKERKKI